MPNSAERALRVAQWTTGNVAKETVAAVLARTDLALVGAYAHSSDKVGVDIGMLCDLGRKIGVTATDDVDALLASELDCVIYTPLRFNAADVQRILSAGVNIVTSAEFMSGINLTRSDRAAIASAATAGGATIFGSGMNPGFTQMIGGLASGLSTRVSRVAVTESVDVSLFLGDANFQFAGWGLPPDRHGHADDVRNGTVVFAEAVDVMARMLRIDLDDIRCEVTFAYATEDVVADGVTIAAGHVGGMDVRWYGVVGGDEVITSHQRWVATRSLEPPWDVEHGYRVEINGDPNVHVKVDLMPTAQDLDDLTPDRMRAIGLRITAAPLVNAIPAVCAAPSGIATYAELPAVSARLQRPE